MRATKFFVLTTYLFISVFISISSIAGEAPYVPGQLIVKFKPGITPTDTAIADFARQYGVYKSAPLVSPETIERFKSAADKKVRGRATKISDAAIGLDRVWLMFLPAYIHVPAVAQAFARHPAVEYAQPNRVFENAPQQLPNDPLFSQQYGMMKISAPTAWDTVYAADTVTVAVLDLAIDINHVDLSQNIWGYSGLPRWCYTGADGIEHCTDGETHGWNFCKNSPEPSFEDFGIYRSLASVHGTHVTGIVAAVGNNNEGVAGAAWSTKVLPVEMNCGPLFYNVTESNAANAVIYAALRGADVINMSWKISGSKASDLPLLDQAFAFADSSGVLLVVAAGNQGQDVDATNMAIFPGSFTHAGIVNVAMTDQNDQLVPGSNYGAISVDLAAPGLDIISTIPPYPYPSSSGAYDVLSGTSMSAPHVAGSAALLKAIHPILTHLQVKQILMGSVDPVPSLTGKTVTGGRLNTAKAVDLVKQTCTYKTPVGLVTSDGDGTGATNQQLKVRFIGNIVNANDFTTTPTTNTVRICPGTTVQYEAITTNQTTALCTLNGAATTSSGSLQISDKLVCTNKPRGQDTDRFRVIQ